MGVLTKLTSKLFHMYFLMSRAATLGVRVAIINDEQQILLIRHTYTDGWHLPGGGIDYGEAPLAAAKREVKEETQIDCDSFQLLDVIHNDWVSKRDYVIAYQGFPSGYHAQADGREIAECRYFDITDLPTDCERMTLAVLNRFS